MNKIHTILYNSIIFRGYRSILRRTVFHNRNGDKSSFANLVLASIKKVDETIFPMFGTLLSIYRDKKFNYADDYDFGVLNLEIFNFDMIDKFERNGFELCSISTVGINNEIVELSFYLHSNGEKIKIDIFGLEIIDDTIRHKCPNFRKEKEYVDFSNGLKISNFNSFFIVDYPIFELVRSNDFDIMLPSDPIKIFEKHYGSDWNIPKESNFIDFSCYQFIREPAKVVSADSIRLKKYILEKCHFKS